MWTLAVVFPFFLPVFLLFWLVRLHSDCAGTTLLRRNEMSGLGARWLHYEVRRRVAMVPVPRHISEYPLPRETRMLVLYCAGVPLWHKVLSIALPDAACAYLDDVPPLAFDDCFPTWLRVASPAAGGPPHQMAW